MFNALSAYENPGISVFGFKIYAYAIIIVCGMVAAFFVISLLFRRRNMSKDLFLTYFRHHPARGARHHAAVLLHHRRRGVPLLVLLYGYRARHPRGRAGPSSAAFSAGRQASFSSAISKKINVFRAADCILVGVLLAQAIGRWGNFANQEVYGAEVTNEALQFFPFAVYINKGTAEAACRASF